jgi:hypothetical protein
VTGSPKPSARQYHSLAYLEDRQQVILFGGDAAGQPRSDLWALDLAAETWEEVTVAGGPSARFSHAAVGIQAVGDLPAGMILYGGTPDGSAGSGLSDLWLLRFNSADEADLALTHTVFPDPSLVNRPVTFTLTIVNHGPTTATNVSLIDTLPQSVTLSIFDITETSLCLDTDSEISCRLSDPLPANAQVVATLVVTPLTTGFKTNQGSVTADEADPDLSNNSRSASVFIFAEEFRSVYLPLVHKGS